MMNATKITMRMLVGTLVIGLATVASGQGQGKSLAASAGIFAYPAKGQTPQQQSVDETECFNWSKTQSGYDPMSPPPAPVTAAPAQPSSPPPDGSRAKGALAGAAAGAVIGEVADNDAGKGAAIGATVGVLAGGRKSRMAQQQKQQQAQAQAQASTEQQKAAQQQQVAAFQRGMSVCLEARGYSVK
jgi:uncharacterized protein YcfJ